MRIFIPFRADADSQRGRLWAHCRERWQAMGAEVVEGDHEGEPFNRSRARNAAAAGAWDVAIFADADVLPANLQQVRAAAARAAETGHLTYAHDWRAGLGQAVTEKVLTGADLASVDREEWDRNTWSGCFAVPRALWDQVGGFDERFVGWGFEDLALMFACGTLGGVSRVHGVIFHLWHPRSRAEQEEQPHYRANEVLWHRYRDARHNRAAMLALVGEPR